MSRTFVLAVAMALSGCFDPSGGGVFRDARLASTLGATCVVAAMSSVRSITDSDRFWMREVWVGGNRPITFTELVSPTLAHTKTPLDTGEYAFMYRTADVKGVRFAILKDAGEGYFVTHDFGSPTGRVPQQESINSIRPVMAELERSLENTCRIPEFAATVREYCLRVACPPLRGP